MLYLLFALILFLMIFNFIGLIISAPKYQGPISDHFDGKQFINPGKVKAKGLSEVLKWMLTRKREPWAPVEQFTKFDENPLSRVAHGLRITFVNHSTFLLQFNNLNVLTDPIWSERTSPFSWAGPKRKRNPGINFEDLPPIDVILLSHNHYDHLDITTVKKLYQKFTPTIVTPLGVKKFLESNGITAANDLDWWQSLNVNESISIHAVPAQHFSGRGSFDRDTTLWCGYIITRKEGNIYFVGDTGYNPNTFKEIGKRFQPIALALIPIGAYKPQWFMSPIHCSPLEAVKIHLDVNAAKSIGTHFGTFALADEGRDEPVDDLKAALRAGEIPNEQFKVLEEGKPHDV